jgi:hypothetical protein
MAGGMLKENELLSENKGEGSQIYFLSQASFRANVGLSWLVVVLDNLGATTTSTYDETWLAHSVRGWKCRKFL